MADRDCYDILDLLHLLSRHRSVRITRIEDLQTILDARHEDSIDWKMVISGQKEAS